MAKAPYTADFTPRKPERDIEEAMSEIEREIRVRQRCFARWVDDGKLTRIDALDRFERLESAWLYLDKLLTLQDKLTEAEPEPAVADSQEEP